MKVKLLKRLRKKSIKNIYIRPPKFSWESYKIITPIQDDVVVIYFYTLKDIKISERMLINKRREYVLDIIYSMRSQFNKIIAKKYFTKELNRINKLIP